MNTTDERGRVVAVLRGHTGPESAYVVPDYPDGFSIRCKQRHWLEHGKTGAQKRMQRHVKQTSDERHGHPDHWRKPNQGTYAERLWLVQFENEHVDSVGLSLTYFSDHHWVRFYSTGIWPHLTPDERGPISTFALGLWRRRPSFWEAFAKRAAILLRELENPPSKEQLLAATGGWMDDEEYAGLVAYVRTGGPVTAEDWQAEEDGTRRPSGEPQRQEEV